MRKAARVLDRAGKRFSFGHRQLQQTGNEKELSPAEWRSDGAGIMITHLASAAMLLYIATMGLGVLVVVVLLLLNLLVRGGEQQARPTDSQQRAS